MKQMIKIQLKQALTSRGFIFSLLIGLSICITHFIFEVIPYYEDMLMYLENDYMLKNVYSTYILWIGQENRTIFSFAYFLLIPLLAALPFGTSFFKEAKSGYIRCICTRTSKKNYCYSKYIATFISGGLAVIIPLLVNFVLTAFIFPLNNPEVVDSVLHIRANHLFSHLCYTSPGIYIVIRLVFIFIFSGLLATYTIYASYFSHYGFIVLCTPFILYLFLISLFNLLDLTSWYPNFILNPGFGIESMLPLLLEGLVILIPTLHKFLIKGRKSDVL